MRSSRNRAGGSRGTGPSDPIRIERLTESYRFDDELARILTAFQYHADGIRLHSQCARPLPSQAVDAATPGIKTVFDAGASLVLVCVDARGHRMVNPVERQLIGALVDAIPSATHPHLEGETDGALAEGPVGSPPTDAGVSDHENGTGPTTSQSPLSVGVVTPHNAQRGALATALPDSITANTVEKYQGGERDIIAVSATVSDPEFARREERFILNPRRLLVAISRSRLLTVVVCSTALFEVAPEDSDRLDNGPLWARLFTQAVGRDSDPAWAGPLDEFVGEHVDEYASVPVRVYPSAIDRDGGEH